MALDEPFSSYEMTNDTAFHPIIVQQILKPTRPIELKSVVKEVLKKLNRETFCGLTSFFLS